MPPVLSRSLVLSRWLILEPLDRILSFDGWPLCS